MRDLLYESSQDVQAQMTQVDSNEYDTLASCQKQKNGTGDEPEIRLWFDKHSRQFQTKRAQPIIHVPYHDGAEGKAPLPAPAAVDAGNGDEPF